MFDWSVLSEHNGHNERLYIIMWIQPYDCEYLMMENFCAMLPEKLDLDL